MSKEEFNYEELALRTLPPAHEYHYDKVPTVVWFSVINNAIVALQELDRVKKTFAYGKPLELAMDYGNGDVTTDLHAVDGDILHAILGAATEAGELLEALALALFDDDKLDLVNIKEEIGDVLWYLAVLAVRSGHNLTDCMIVNILKLEVRYGDKFTAERALIRDLAVERGILEDH